MKIHKCDICLYGQTDKCTNPYGNSGDCFVAQSENTVIEKLIRCDERAKIINIIENCCWRDAEMLVELIKEQK